MIQLSTATSFASLVGSSGREEHEILNRSRGGGYGDNAQLHTSRYYVWARRIQVCLYVSGSMYRYISTVLTVVAMVPSRFSR